MNALQMILQFHDEYYLLFLDLSTSSEDEEEISQRQRLNAKNPMFPQL